MRTADAAAAAAAATAAAATDTDVLDVQLFKVIGLSGVIEPGPDSRKYRQAVAACVWLLLGMCTTQLCGTYFVLKDIEQLSRHVVLINLSLSTCAKGRALARHADRLWRVLELSRYAFTSSGRRYPSELTRCRSTFSTLGRTFVAINYGVLLVWVVSPFFIREPTRVIHRDGAEAQHRAVVLYMWTPLSDTAYNSTPYWTVVYAVEVIVCAINVGIWVMFDCYLIAVCLTLNAQFRTVTAAYRTLGDRPPRDGSTATGHYDDLLCYIEDNQKIIGKYDDFFNVIQPVVRIQIALGSTSGIMLIFIASLMYMTRYPLLSVPVMKYFSGFTTITMQIFFYCYAFTYVETAKSAVNFGLYSSNWTEMDLKFKKTLLLAMCMNSGHKRVMKMSPLSVINLEMFIRLMKLSYTIVSVLLNRSVE